MRHATQYSIGPIKSPIFLGDDGPEEEQGRQAYPNDCKRRRESTAKPDNKNRGAIGENTDGEQRRVLKTSEDHIYRLDEYCCVGSESCDLVVETPVREFDGHAHGAGIMVAPSVPSKVLSIPSTDQASSERR